MKKLSLLSVLLLLVSCGSVNVSSIEEVIKISTPEQFMAINTKSNVINY